ncbi:ATP-binding protein [Caulobacter sp. NIBR2454]|uniref:ATP-binding protein n=1 Tax=Caulobacter sp. NIBR2454 TaxID=3015996 RepID=UPI0022B63EDC|nr:ATP-binding protein [Caulobacter sp. NIBR2454]
MEVQIGVPSSTLPAVPTSAAAQVANEQNLALQAAARARLAAEQAVKTEAARLMSLKRQYELQEQELTTMASQTGVRRDAVLGWRARAREAALAAGPADSTYTALRGALRAARQDLASTLDMIASGPVDLAEVGPDPLFDLPEGVDAREVEATRAALTARRVKLVAATHATHVAVAADLLNEISVLNDSRLALLVHLSPAKRAAVTGFTATGWDQARAEARQLILLARYHAYAASDWVATALLTPASTALSALAGSSRVLIPWAILSTVFLWWRRQSTRVFASWEEILALADRRALRPSPSCQLRALRFIRSIRRPLGWLVLYFALMSVLPSALHDLLEVKLLSLIVLWALGGALVVAIINAAFADSSTRRLDPQQGRQDLSRIRLRSLSLIGGVIVAYGLILSLTAELVGQGTIYRWVGSTAWFAIVAVLLMLVRWWMSLLFAWAETHNRKSAFHQWVLEHRIGPIGFLAATLVAVEYAGIATGRLAHRWFGSLALVRRAAVFLFRREMLRRQSEQHHEDRRWIDGPVFDALGPDTPSSTWIATDAESQIAAWLVGTGAPAPRTIALVGERGAGKTSSLRQLTRALAGAIVIDCGESCALDAIIATIAAEADSAPGNPPPAILIDNVQAMIRPVMGGLRLFDELMSLIRQCESGVTWVLAIDSAIWPFLVASRGSRPMFDQVITLGRWPDTAIGALLDARCEQAGIDPSYEDLLEPSMAETDEIYRLDALAAKKAAYTLLVWDYASGNPGVALDVWRRSLAAGPSGHLFVRPMHTPKAAELDLLVDETLLVLRAVLQGAPTTAHDIQSATRLSSREVENALRFCTGHGILDEHEGRIQASWTWHREITRKLERRHLMASA